MATLYYYTYHMPPKKKAIVHGMNKRPLRVTQQIGSDIQTYTQSMYKHTIRTITK